MARRGKNSTLRNVGQEQNNGTQQIMEAAIEDEHMSDQEENANLEPIPATREEPQRRVRGPNQGAPIPRNEDEKALIYTIGGRFTNTKVISDITTTLRGHIEEAWPSWLKVPSDVKELLWEEFQEKWRWEQRTNEIRQAWNNACINRFRDIICAARKSAAEATQSSNPVDWKGHNPYWIGGRIWNKLIDDVSNKLIDDVWSTDKWLKKSRSGKSNRMTLKDGKIPTHSGGSIPFAAHQEKLTRELKRKPTEVELYDRTHKGEKGKGEYICPNAKKIRENYDHSMEDKYPEPETRPTFDLTLWREVSGISSKKRAYDFGFESEEQDPNKIQEFEKKMEEMNARSEDLSKQLGNFETKLPDMIRTLLQEAGWSNNVYPGGSGHNQQRIIGEDVSNDNQTEDSFEAEMESHNFRDNARKKSAKEVGKRGPHHGPHTRNGGKKK